MLFDFVKKDELLKSEDIENEFVTLNGFELENSFEPLNFVDDEYSFDCERLFD